jgi:hypothetical protein
VNISTPPFVVTSLHRARPYANVPELARGAWGKWKVILAAAFVNLVASNGLEVTFKGFHWSWLSEAVDGMGMSWKAAVVQAILHSVWVGAAQIAAKKNRL